MRNLASGQFRRISGSFQKEAPTAQQLATMFSDMTFSPAAVVLRASFGQQTRACIGDKPVEYDDALRLRSFVDSIKKAEIELAVPEDLQELLDSDVCSFVPFDDDAAIRTRRWGAVIATSRQLSLQRFAMLERTAAEIARCLGQLERQVRIAIAR